MYRSVIKTWTISLFFTCEKNCYFPFGPQARIHTEDYVQVKSLVFLALYIYLKALNELWVLFFFSRRHSFTFPKKFHVKDSYFFKMLSLGSNLDCIVLWAESILH